MGWVDQCCALDHLFGDCRLWGHGNTLSDQFREQSRWCRLGSLAMGVRLRGFVVQSALELDTFRG